MVDPRKADISSVYLNDVVPKLPKKWQESIKARIEESPTFVEDQVLKRFEQLVMPFISPVPFLGAPNSFARYEDIRLDKVVQKRVTLIVGLHADGATEAIVDAALAYNKRFVIVPCCFFPNLFRRYLTVITGSGEGEPSAKQIQVRTHAQFCQYLLDKDPRFVREELPFEGRNVAIWWDGK